ncbi:MAG: M20/M25/M40 family metallo-hydrolase [Acidobacteria bacterium]|nr:M20/M25/M40 family metallo-hydrolase [Acidobacteriota bacterium]
MTRPRRTPLLLFLCAAGLAAARGGGRALAGGGQAAPAGQAERAMRDAADAWERGDYTTALVGYMNVLSGPDGDPLLDRIALQTGELYVTSELTPDGRAPRFSPDGRFIVYETGLEVSRRTRILRNDGSRELVAELPGASATFPAESGKVAYLKVPAGPEIGRAAADLERAALTASNRGLLINSLAWLIARDSTIAVRDLATQREIDIAVPGLLKTGLAYAPDGRTLYFLGADPMDESRTDIYAAVEGGQPVRVVGEPGLKSTPLVAASGTALIYTIPSQNPLRRPAPPPPARPAAPAAVRPALPQFAIVDLATHRASIVSGSAPALSGDGRTLAFVAATAERASVLVGPVLGAHTAVVTVDGRLDAPALSADGSRLAYQRMDRDDWDIFVAGADGSGERRLTHDIQHDVLPRFMDGNRLLWAVGEPRHRRSFLVDIASAEAAPVRLFHNNTVRTIAPEYQWAPSPDGSALLVGAERDGDTVSPARGIYLIDLKTKVAKADLLRRLKTSLDGELALRAAAIRTFQPVAERIRQVVDQVSVARIYSYEKALFDLDSKHITQPGNRKASELLFRAYASFGYAPEYQWFEPPNALGGRTANVVAALRGTVDPDLVYVISSHYDSVAAGPGADDDSSGTAALLEAARVLADHPLPATVVFASMTGEESGLLGSREFVRRSFADKLNVVGALNNDMIGWSNDQRIDNTIRYSNPGVRDIQHGAAMLFTNLITYDALYWKGTDAASYYDTYGDIVGGIGSYPVLSSPFYHQPSDLLRNIHHEQIAETSKATVATIMLMASSPSRLKDLKVQRSGTTASVSWAPSPEKSVGAYVVACGPPDDLLRTRTTVNAPAAALERVAAGDVVSVKAVNASGLEGWSWATAVVP